LNVTVPREEKNRKSSVELQNHRPALHPFPGEDLVLIFTSTRPDLLVYLCK